MQPGLTTVPVSSPDEGRGEASVRDAYNSFAPIYDETTSQNDYELWVGKTLIPELERYGLKKGRALDIGCGTGRAFEPLLARGWQVVGCDISAGMLREAARKFQQSDVELFEADARDMPSADRYLGLPRRNFDLILLLNDVVNYTIEEGDLEKVFAGVKLNLLRNHGLAIFDANTLAQYGDAYTSQQMEARMNAGELEWQGLSDEVQPGFVYEARLSGRSVEAHIHRQRHWTDEQVKEALDVSGLRLLAALGQQEKDGQISLSDPPDERRDSKIIYIAADRPAVWSRKPR